MKVKNDAADFGCLNASSHVVCLKNLLLENMIFKFKQKLFIKV